VAVAISPGNAGDTSATSWVFLANGKHSSDVKIRSSDYPAHTEICAECGDQLKALGALRKQIRQSDLFEQASLRSFPFGSQQGYNWLRWQSRGMELCLVSDTSGEDLRQLENLIDLQLSGSH